MVVLIINKFFYEKGGTERYLFMQSDALEQRGHKVVHFSMEHPANRPSEYSKHFVSQRDYSAKPGLREALSSARRFVRSEEAAEKLRRLLAETRPDVAHLHNIYHQLTPSIIPVLREHNIPIVMTLHDYKLVCPNYSLYNNGRFCDRCLKGSFFNAPVTRCNQGSFASSLLLAVEAYVQRSTGVYDGVDRFLAPSRFMRATFIRAGFDGDRITYLPAFLPMVTEGPIDPAAGIEVPPDYMLYFGRLGEEKGLMTLLRAVAQAGDLPLVLCGEGPLRATLEQRARELELSRVVFTGHVDKETLDGIIRRARAVVLPSESSENAPFTVLEAAAAGIPVVVSDQGGLPEMAHTIGGLVVRAGDVQGFASALRELWEDPRGATDRGLRGREEARKYWDQARHLDALESTYKQLIADRSAA